MPPWKLGGVLPVDLLDARRRRAHAGLSHHHYGRPERGKFVRWRRGPSRAHLYTRTKARDLRLPRQGRDTQSPTLHLVRRDPSALICHECDLYDRA